MTKHTGNLAINQNYLNSAENRKYLDRVTEITGSVWIDAEGNHLPACKTIGGSVRIFTKGNHLPICKSVGGRAIKSQTYNDQLLYRIAEIVIENPKKLEMNEWHCGSSHCIAGWAQVLAHSDGEEGVAIDDDRALQDSNILLGLKHSGLFHLKANEALNALVQHKGRMDAKGAVGFLA